jgi:hypothetical protein
MSKVNEAVRLYRNDPFVSDVLFGKILEEAYEMDAGEEEEFSVSVANSVGNNLRSLVMLARDWEIPEEAFDLLTQMRERMFGAEDDK